MKATTFIYALCEPGTRTVRYIGKSNRPERRLRDHLYASAKQKNHLGNWLRFLISRNERPDLVVLREVSIDKWEEAEERYIRLARGSGMKLVNSTDGGAGCFAPSPETLEKMCKASLNRTPETKAKYIEYCRNRPKIHNDKIGLTNRNPSVETRVNISTAAKARWLKSGPVSSATSAKLSAATKGFCFGHRPLLKNLPLFSDGGGV